jgi:hypothetical protein
MPGKIQITTLTTAAVAEPADDLQACETRRTCEGVHTVAGRPDRYYVIVTEETDPEITAAFRGYVGRGEYLGSVARRIIDEVPR